MRCSATSRSMTSSAMFEQVDVPGGLHRLGHIRLHDRLRDRPASRSSSRRGRRWRRPRAASGTPPRADARRAPRSIPGERVRHRVDVVPTAGVKPDEVLAERSADLHQLEARVNLLHQHVPDDAAALEPEWSSSVSSRSAQDAASATVWIFGIVQDDRAPLIAQRLVVVDSVEDEVGDRRREPSAVLVLDVAIVEVQAAGTEDPGGEPDLLPPVGDDLLPWKSLAHVFISRPLATSWLAVPGRRRSRKRSNPWTVAHASYVDGRARGDGSTAFRPLRSPGTDQRCRWRGSPSTASGRSRSWRLPLSATAR
jgi:hypothetical protein